MRLLLKPGTRYRSCLIYIRETTSVSLKRRFREVESASLRTRSNVSLSGRKSETVDLGSDVLLAPLKDRQPAVGVALFKPPLDRAGSDIELLR
jgi:hypothetical protein